MPLDTLPGSLTVPGRNQERDRYRSNYLLRNPGVATGEGTQVWIDASVTADQTAVIYANAVLIANSVTRATSIGPQLDAWAAAAGTIRQPAVGASGSVIITAGATGTQILAGDELTVNGTRYECAATGTYLDGANVPVTGIDTGYGTNQPPGTVLTWTAPRPGCATTATVYEQEDGDGLTGGAPAETDFQLRTRLDNLAANPPASGNDAQYQLLIGTTPNVAVQQPFTYPCIKGPGSKGITATLRPAQSGASRIPNSTQLNAIASWCKGQMPADDGIFLITLVANPVNVNMELAWTPGAGSWADAAPWPPYVSGAQIAVDASQPATATSFSLTGNNGTNVAPVVGQSIAMLDLPNLVFRQKKILTVTASGTDWVITVDTTNGVSDTSYTPFGGQIVGPWSTALNSVVQTAVGYFDGLGPGEMVNSFVDPGLRQRRSPSSPGTWPNQITNRVLSALFDLDAIEDVALLDPAIPFVAPSGNPGVSAYMNTLNNLAFFAEALT
jgi:uncharacterized phage protein gp47/JayE